MPKWQTTTALNVRSGPGPGYEILDTLHLGDIVVEIPTAGWVALEMEDGSIGFASRKYLVDSIVEATAHPGGGQMIVKPLPPGPVVVPSGEPPQIVWARKYLGTKEAAGSADNPTIVAWDKLLTTLPASMRHDSTPWCAIFVHAAFHNSGYPDAKDIDSAAAVDWLKFGVKITDPKKGDVVVFNFNGQHHVAFVLSVSGGLVHVIGGNQSDAVTLASYSTEAVMGYRRAA